MQRVTFHPQALISSEVVNLVEHITYETSAIKSASTYNPPISFHMSFF